MSTQKKAPFKYDIVGSFLRPEKLKIARADFEQGKISKDELLKIENEAIIDLVKKEKEAGLKAVTDGEFRRGWWHLDFFWGLYGVEKVFLERGYIFNDEETRAETAQLSGKISFGNHPFLEHFKFLKEIAGNDVTARQTIPSPAQFLFELDRKTNIELTKKFYPDRYELKKDIAKVYQDAIKAFYDLGCRNLQLDDCTWGSIVDKNVVKILAAKGVSAKNLAEEFVELNNEAIKEAPEDLVITTHVCRGNYHSTWASSGGYDSIAEYLFARENVEAFYLEYDTERAGGFEPLKFIGDNKKVVLGLITSKLPKLENKEVIIERIKEASKYVPLERLCLSPQCGFASTEEGNILTEEEQWNKINLVKEIAEEIWGK